MLSDRIRSRLEQLNRERLPEPMAPHVPLASQETPAAEPPHSADIRVDPQAFTLETLAPGVVCETPRGSFHRIERRLVDYWPAAERFVAEALRRFAAAPPPRSHVDSLPFRAGFPEHALFLDLETCGLASSPIFLVGLLHYTGGQLTLDQLLARNYAEEAALLCWLAGVVRRQQVLVTFNGKSFDWPLVCERTGYHRLTGECAPSATTLPHVDLLHHARRRYRRRLPNCRLQTLERFVCQRHRSDDIPGSQIPQEYHHFVRTGDARQIAAILEHNALDLVTLAELALRLIA